ncbi:5-bromo-4-chloroindolyl phosphate hydrolysis family protein [Vagococcus sp. JNUCC 83]
MGIEMIGLIFVLAIIAGIIVYQNREKVKLIIGYKQGIRNYKKKHHLSKNDLDLFKETMGVAKNQIIEWKELVENSNNLRNNTEINTAIQSAEEIFKRLMEYPNEMTGFNDFLYVKLPGVLSATKRYESIEASSIDTQEIKESMKSILLSLIFICESITDDYEESIVDVMNEIDLTKKVLEKQR